MAGVGGWVGTGVEGFGFEEDGEEVTGWLGIAEDYTTTPTIGWFNMVLVSVYEMMANNLVR